MLTDDEARDLLRKAGETVHVDSSHPIAQPARHRRLLTAGAALAVAATVIVMFVVAGQLRDHDATTTPTKDPTTWPTGVPNAYVLDDDQVPLLFGFTIEQAREELESRGFAVQVRHVKSCDLPDRVTVTDPEVGTRVKPGGTVTVVTAAEPANTRCNYLDQKLAWSMIDFASGRGAAPAFADEVDYHIGDLAHATLSRVEAQHRASWDLCPAGLPTACPLSPLRELLARQYWTVNGQPVMPHLELGRGPSTYGCFGDRQLLGSREALLITITIPIDGVSCSNPVSVYSRDGVIDAIVLGTTFEKDQLPYSTEVQPVIGMTEDEARTHIEPYGQRMQVIPPEDTNTCIAATPPVVADQDPAATASIKAGSTVTVRMRWVLCGEVPTTKLAAAFVAYARGLTDNAPWAPEVRVYLGNQLQKTITADEANRRSSWEVCAAYAQRSCPMSALRIIAEFDQEPVYETFVAGCMARPIAEPPIPLGARFAVITDAEPRTCAEDFSVQMWFDGNQIAGVNLLLGVDP